MVCEREWLARQLRAGYAGGGGLSRRDKFAKRVCVTDSQPDNEGSTASECAVPAGLFSDSIRPGRERLGAGEPVLRVVRIARRAVGAGLVCDSRLDAYGLSEGGVFSGAVLPLQPGELRFTRKRLSSGDYVAPEVGLRGCAGGCARGCWGEQLLRRDVQLLPGRERFVWAGDQRQELCR